MECAEKSKQSKKQIQVKYSKSLNNCSNNYFLGARIKLGKVKHNIINIVVV